MVGLRANTVIKYKIRVNNENNYELELTMEQLEGSTPCFVKQLREALELKKDDIVEIIEREVKD